jgi:ABC-type antimicrobial peptide transport system permease subunit
MAFCALLLALVIVSLFLPQFNRITGKELILQFDFWLIAAMAGITLFTGLISGSYPALYLSGLNTSHVLKSKLNRNSAMEFWARKGLVIFQFSISIILIVSVLIVHQQMKYIQAKNLGYDKQNLVMFDREGNVAANQETFLQRARQIPGISDASSLMGTLLGTYNSTMGVGWEGKDPDAQVRFELVNGDYRLVETLGLELLEGRSFSPQYGDENNKLIFNRAAIEVMGLEEPLGKNVVFWGQEAEIIGVVENFHFESLYEIVKPLVIRYVPEETINIVVRLEVGREQEAMAELKALYHEYNPGFPFNYHFLDQQYQKLYMAEQRVSSLSFYFAGLAILISCLGLFGLTAFTAQRRLKEIGIRKILGSSVFSLIRLLSADFTWMVIVSIVISLPLSYLAAREWLSGFAYFTDLNWWLFALAGLAALLVAWVTVGWQTFKAANINPTVCLRDD